jgi:hypothetical protein
MWDDLVSDFPASNKGEPSIGVGAEAWPEAPILPTRPQPLLLGQKLITYLLCRHFALHYPNTANCRQHFRKSFL